MLSDRKSLIILFVIFIISLTLFILVLARFSDKPTQGNLKPSTGVKTEEITEDVDISHFFESPLIPKDEKEITPTPPKGGKAKCILEGIKVQEGTVASDTVCVSQP